MEPGLQRGSIWASISCLLMVTADSVHAQASQSVVFIEPSPALATQRIVTASKKLMQFYLFGLKNVCWFCIPGIMAKKSEAICNKGVEIT